MNTGPGGSVRHPPGEAGRLGTDSERLGLGRLWHQQGRRKEAHALVAEVYAWFTEGFDTADLQEAKASLEELA